MKYFKRYILFFLTVLVLLTGCKGEKDTASELGEEQKEALAEKYHLDAPQPPSSQAPHIDGPQAVPEEQRQFIREAYLPIASPTPDEETLSKLTDLVLIGGAVWNEKGEITTADDTPFVLTEDILQKGTDINLWLTINPSGRLIREGTAGQTIDTPQEREHVAENITEFVCRYGYAGVDIDWEFPANEQEWADFSLLAVLLEEKLEEAGKQLSLTFYPQEVQLSQEALLAADRIHIMAYDMFDDEGNHSSFDTAEQGVRYFLDKGCYARQLVLGIPLYGRPADQSPRWDLYKDLPTTEDFSQNRYGDSYYNGIHLILQKADLAWEKDLGGVMLYHLDCDLPVTEKASAVHNLDSWMKEKTEG